MTDRVKCHKGWYSSKGGTPHTRPVIGGNQGMNSHLSELLSWLLQPLATEMIGKCSEVNSRKDLKSSLHRLNVANQDWEPAAELVRSLGEWGTTWGRTKIIWEKYGCLSLKKIPQNGLCPVPCARTSRHVEFLQMTLWKLHTFHSRPSWTTR